MEIGRHDGPVEDGKELLEALLDAIPDEPFCVDLRGLLLSGRCTVFANPNPAAGFVALSWDFPFAGVAGEPDPEIFRSVRAGLQPERCSWVAQGLRAEFSLLAAPESYHAVERSLDSWQEEGVVIHTAEHLHFPSFESDDYSIELLPHGLHGGGLDLGHVAETSRAELELDWVARRPFAIARDQEGRPVTFVYAALETETLWDASVETLEGHRRRGLAAACYQVLAGHMEGLGKRPTWGALVDNQASMKLAAKLGFREAATLTAYLTELDR